MTYDFCPVEREVSDWAEKGAEGADFAMSGDPIKRGAIG